MPLAIENYALIGDLHTGCLVGTDGSIDWLCLPRFDSASTFGALLGDHDSGRWLIAPRDAAATSTRRYVDGTFVLVTTWTTPTGVVEVRGAADGIDVGAVVPVLHDPQDPRRARIATLGWPVMDTLLPLLGVVVSALLPVTMLRVWLQGHRARRHPGD